MDKLLYEFLKKKNLLSQARKIFFKHPKIFKNDKLLLKDFLLHTLVEKDEKYYTCQKKYEKFFTKYSKCALWTDIFKNDGII